MSLLKTLAGKLLLVPLAIENGIVFGVGLVGASMWLSSKALEGGYSDPWGAFLASWLTFSKRVTVTFLVFGGLAWFLRRVRSRILNAPIGMDASQAWVLLVMLILMVHGVLATFFAHRLPLLFQENIELLQSWMIGEGLQHGGELSGIFLVPVFGVHLAPGLAAMTVFTFIAGATASIGYLVMGLEKAPRVLLRSLCLQIPFLLSLFFISTLFEAGSRAITEGFTGPEALELKAKVLPLIARQIAVLDPLAQRLTWLLHGFFFCAVVVLWKAYEKALKDNEIPNQFPEEISIAGSTQIGSTGSFLETDVRFKHKSYLIKWKFISNAFYKVFEIYDPDNKLLFVARMNGLSLVKRVIKVYAVEKKQSETLSISGRRVFLFPEIFDMTYCPIKKKVGTFKNTGTGWIITDEYGRQIAAMKRLEETSWGTTKAEIWMGDMPVCKYDFQNIIRPIIMIDFPDDPVGVFDKRFGIGLALVLCFQSVAFKYPSIKYSSGS